MSTSPLFIVAREFICYTTEAYFAKSNIAYARAVARHLQLSLVVLPDRAREFADEAARLLATFNWGGNVKWPELEAVILSFAAYIQPEITNETDR